MKLTKIHIFLILLLALVLCSTLGMCANQGLEGFSNRSDDKRSYDTYSDYNTQKNDDNVRSVNHSDNNSLINGNVIFHTFSNNTASGQIYGNAVFASGSCYSDSNQIYGEITDDGTCQA